MQDQPYEPVPRWDERLDELLNAEPVPRRWTDAPWPGGPIPVTARLAWRDRGIEHLETTANSWTQTTVRVRITGTHYWLTHAWIPAKDVRRRRVGREG